MALPAPLINKSGDQFTPAALVHCTAQRGAVLQIASGTFGVGTLTLQGTYTLFIMLLSLVQSVKRVQDC